MATIRRVPSVEHNFQLVITRVFEEGDQELLEDEDETDEERVFLISEELEFRTGHLEGEPTFIWRDLHGDIDEFYEYVATGTNDPTRAFFETCMYRAMHERKYRRSADNTRDNDLGEFIYRSVLRFSNSPFSSSKWQSIRPPAKRKPNSKKSAKKSALKQSSDAVPITEEKTDTEQPLTPSSLHETGQSKTTTKEQALQLPSPQVLLSGEAELYYWDPDMGFQHQGITTAQILQQEGRHFEFWLAALYDGNYILVHKITSDMNQRWSHKMLSLTWNYLGDNGSQHSWLFKFLGESEFEKTLEVFTQCLWESLHQSEWHKAKVTCSLISQQSSWPDFSILG
ncbi:hypothetical protein AX17_000974 [Amanita inopinata Kibby_2008]|nr:hypothetical protein AX17_000974 [Amanita inopinata Kibby_2008]